jgi:hypothetical protein
MEPEKKDPTRYRTKEELISDMMNMSASEDKAAGMIETSEAMMNEFAKNIKDLTNNFLNDLREKMESQTKDVADRNNRGALIGLVGFNTFHEMVCVMLSVSSDVASLGRIGLPSFIKHAAEHYEQAALRDSLEMMTSSLLEKIMKFGPEPKKEDLS